MFIPSPTNPVQQNVRRSYKVLTTQAPYPEETLSDFVTNKELFFLDLLKLQWFHEETVVTKIISLMPPGYVQRLRLHEATHPSLGSTSGTFPALLRLIKSLPADAHHSDATHLPRPTP